ncbi:MAG: DUF4352 domain-containing protein [Acidobacteriota bacterium]
MTKLATAVLLAALCVFALGCSTQGSAARGARTYRMGERVQAGPLIYTILDAEWLDQIGEPPNPRMPSNRFLVVRLSVTNSGVVASGVPPLAVIDTGGEAHEELNDAGGVSEWLGYLRSVKPADTLTGRVVFDVPAATYQLKVSNDAEPESAVTALVDIPLDLTRR